MSNTAVSKKYIPHLANLQAVCEANYGRLMALLPEVDSQDMEYQFDAAQGSVFTIRILSCEPYTTTLEMSQCQNGLPDYFRPQMQVRIYHDARMAEVLGFQHMGRFRSSYDYPNRLMHQKNEKELVNLFLAEWLEFCLRQQQSAKA